MFSATMCILLLSAVNAFSLTLTTLFLKLLRVYHIFKSSNHLKSNLGKKFKNYSLFFNSFYTLLALTPNIIFLLSLLFEIPTMIIYRKRIATEELPMVVIKNTIAMKIFIFFVSLKFSYMLRVRIAR